VAALGDVGREASQGSFNIYEREKDLDALYDRLKRLPPDPKPVPEAMRGCYQLAEQFWVRGWKEQATRAAEASRAIGDKLEAGVTFGDQDRLLRAQARLLLGRIAVERLLFEDANGHYRKALTDLDSCSAQTDEVIRKKAEVHHRLGEMYNAQP